MILSVCLGGWVIFCFVLAIWELRHLEAMQTVLLTTKLKIHLKGILDYALSPPVPQTACSFCLSERTIER